MLARWPSKLVGLEAVGPYLVGVTDQGVVHCRPLRDLEQQHELKVDGRPLLKVVSTAEVRTGTGENPRSGASYGTDGGAWCGAACGLLLGTHGTPDDLS